jgi:hypothetical protein
MGNRQELAEKYAVLKQGKDRINEELKGINAALEDIEQQLVLTMENEGLQSFKDETFGTFYLRQEIYARVEDEEKAFAWLRAAEMEDVIKRSVHAKTLAALVKEHGEIEGVKSHYVTKIGMRRS